MTNVTWPNAAAPGLASFRLDVPDSWTAVEAPGALLILLGPEADGFRPNLIVFGQRLDRRVSVAEVADAAATDGDAIIVDRGPDQAGSAENLAAALRHSAEVAEGLEIHHLVVSTEADDVSPAGLRSVFTLVGSCQAAHLNRDRPMIETMIESFRIRTPAPAAS